MSEIKQAERIQTSFINAVEKKVLVWFAHRMPKWVNPDMLTFLGTFGAMLIGLGFILSRHGINYLWLAVFGFFVNWFGDSLDGTLARVRNTQRPIYGYYLDHTVDCFNEMFMFIGMGLSPFMNLSLALIGFLLYILMTLNVNMNAHLRKEFKLTYAKLGPTELRIVMVVVILLFIFIPSIPAYSREMTICGAVFTVRILDYIAFGICCILGLMYLSSVAGDIRYYSKIDPPKKFD